MFPKPKQIDTKCIKNYISLIYCQKRLILYVPIDKKCDSSFYCLSRQNNNSLLKWTIVISTYFKNVNTPTFSTSSLILCHDICSIEICSAVNDGCNCIGKLSLHTCLFSKFILLWTLDLKFPMFKINIRVFSSFLHNFDIICIISSLSIWFINDV